MFIWLLGKQNNKIEGVRKGWKEAEYNNLFSVIIKEIDLLNNKYSCTN